MGKSRPLPTIWEIPDDLWERIEPVILELDPPKGKGRKRVDQRKMLEGVIFHLRSGCQWNRLPRELGDDSTIHRTFQRWVELGAHMGRSGGGVRGTGWRGMGMAVRRLRYGQGTFWGDSTGRKPTDRGKAGSKRSILVDAGGGPLSLMVAGANVHDTKLLALTLESKVVERPDTGIQHLCLHKVYDNPTGHKAVANHRYRGHIKRMGRS